MLESHGYAPDELIGQHVHEFVLSDDHSKMVGAYETAAAGNQLKIGNRYRHKDGSTRTISWVAAPAGNMTYATGRDVTAEREMEPGCTTSRISRALLSRL